MSRARCSGGVGKAKFRPYPVRQSADRFVCFGCTSRGEVEGVLQLREDIEPDSGRLVQVVDPLSRDRPRHSVKI